MRCLGLAALLLVGCDKPAPPAKPAPLSEVGRFTIIEADGRTFLVDTDRGKTWVLLEVDGEPKGWSPVGGI